MCVASFVLLSMLFRFDSYTFNALYKMSLSALCGLYLRVPRFMPLLIACTTQCSCLENPGDGGAWWAAVYGVAQSRTRLK